MRRSSGCPILEVSETRLNGALSNLVLWKVPLPVAGELKWDDL